jgi:PilZ domain
MPKQDEKVFYRIPNEQGGKKQILHAGVVLSLDDDVCVVQLEEPCAAIEENVDGFLHFEQKQKFFQQAARVVRKESAEPTVFELKLQGQPVSAESRQCYRVSCLGAGIKATVADEKDCEVVDVSATGLAFYATGTFEIGRQVRITFFYNGDEYVGQGTIQSMRRVSARLIRYGLHCGDTKSKTDTLARSLASINQSIQRDQLRRLAGKE